MQKMRTLSKGATYFPVDHNAAFTSTAAYRTSNAATSAGVSAAFLAAGDIAR